MKDQHRHLASRWSRQAGGKTSVTNYGKTKTGPFRSGKMGRKSRQPKSTIIIEGSQKV